MGEIINPYIAGAPVTEARMFFGREDVFDWIEKSITGQYAEHILVIHGQRRVGKTSVLKQLGNRLPSKYIPVFFDLQGRTHTTLDRFLWWLAREIVRELKQESNIDISLPQKEAFTEDAEFFENHFLPDLQSRIGARTLLLTFDEFDNLEESEIKEALGRPLIDHLRRLMGIQGLTFIFSIGSSGRKLENMQASYTEFFKTALYKKISFLSEDQTLKLVTRPVEGILEYEPAAVERIYAIASGHPYFTQLTCHEIFARCQQTEQRRVQKADVEAILDDVVERGTVNLKFVWDDATDLEKWILAALAQLEKTDNRSLAEYLRKQRVRFSDTDLNSSLLHLREKDVLTSENRFIIQLLKRWLEKNRPIEQVREELTEVNPIANRYIEIGLEFSETRQYDQAIDSFQRALEIDPDNIQAQVNIAAVDMSQKDYEKAVIEFEKALAFDDEDVTARSGLCEAHLALGDVAIRRNRPREAIQSYQRVLAINVEHTEARQRMAELMRQRAEKALTDGKDEEALSAFSEALKYTPEEPVLIKRVEQVRSEKKTKVLAAQFARVEREAMARNWDKAIAALNEALEISPSDESILKKIAEVKESQSNERLKAILTKADQAEKLNRWDTAIAALREYLSLKEDDVKIQKRLADLIEAKHSTWLKTILTRTDQAIATQNWDDAFDALNEILSLEPENLEIQKKMEEARKAQRTANLDLMLRQAEQALQTGKWDEAIDALNQGIALAPEDERFPAKLTQVMEAKRTARLKAALRLAETAAQSGKWNVAIDSLNEILAVEPDNHEIQNKLKEIRIRQRENQLNTLRTQAKSMQHAERFDEALSAWQAYLALEPDDREAAQTQIGLVQKAQVLAKSYAAAQNEYTKKNYDKAIGLLKEIVVENAEYKDASSLMAEAIELRRTARGWWQSRWLWSGVGIAAIIGMVFLAIRFAAPFITDLTAPRAESITPNTPQSTNLTAATIVVPSSSPTLAPTAISVSWARLNPGQFLPRDQITAIVVDPTDPGIMYVGTENAGVYKSIDGGLSWQPAGNGLGGTNIGTLIIDPNLPSTLYAGVINGGVYKTIDGATTWLPVNSGIDLLGGELVSILAIDRQNSQHLYFTQRQHVYETSDGGTTWAQLNNPACMTDISNLAINPQDPKNISIMELKDNNSWQCSMGIYKTQDDGKTWTLVPIPVPQSSNGYQDNSLAIDSRNANNIFFGDYEGNLYASKDNGTTWSQTKANCSSFTFDPANPRRTYCAGSQGLWVSNDQGTTWSLLSIPGTGAFNTVALSALAPDFVLAGSTGLYLSQNNGKAWNEQDSGLAGSIFQLKLDPANGSTLYGEDNGGNSYVSTDSGETWNQSKIGTSSLNPPTIPSLPCQPLAYWSSNPQVGYAIGCVLNQAYYTKDGGKTWNNCGTSPGTNSWIMHSYTRAVIDPRDSNRLMIASGGNGILLSTNGCQTWQLSDQGLGNLFVNSVVRDPNHPDTIYVGTQGGSYLSYDNGQAWGKINDGLLGAIVVYSIVVDKDSNVYAATPYGIFKLASKD
jgi:tetratricopeptide (TPR) repeat protein/photosystem II stability/assembly factor-like uncharacterized protein